MTDDEWYRFLAARPEISETEVNFGGRAAGAFRALTAGEPFFFKTHAPHNRICSGGGFFSGFAALRVSEAWQMFGLASRRCQPPPDAGAHCSLGAGAYRASRRSGRSGVSSSGMSRSCPRIWRMTHRRALRRASSRARVMTWPITGFPATSATSCSLSSTGL